MSNRSTAYATICAIGLVMAGCDGRVWPSVAVEVQLAQGVEQATAEVALSTIDKHLIAEGFKKLGPSGYAALTGKEAAADYERNAGGQHVSVVLTDGATIQIRLSEHGDRVSEQLSLVGEKLAMLVQDVPGIAGVRVDRSRSERSSP